VSEATKLLSARQVAARYGDISERSLHRWILTGALPEPTWINRRRYWPVDALDTHDAARAPSSAAGKIVARGAA
jgi:hypothetical protein